MKKRILIVDDEEDLCEILQFNLESEGYQINVAYSAEEALEQDLKLFDLLLLDVMMGGMSGFKLANMIKNELKLNLPIIFLTAKNTENDTLTGFNVGADDFISKPFSIKEVIARVKAVLNRTGSSQETQLSKLLQVDEMVLNLKKKSIKIEGKKLDLTKKEFEILVLLVENEGRVFGRDEILQIVWASDVIVVDRTVDVNIARIRNKLGVYGKMIKSRSGYGYCFEKS
ncbi:MAG: response regulator transcription factor [Bacteroidales bacterium]|nr:response regulator transcription factor [Bacteroidales bacterium]MCF8404128.1 response regulator transcription factor [Bacteroidales bacterium]